MVPDSNFNTPLNHAGRRADEARMRHAPVQDSLYRIRAASTAAGMQRWRNMIARGERAHLRALARKKVGRPSLSKRIVASIQASFDRQTTRVFRQRKWENRHN